MSKNHPAAGSDDPGVFDQDVFDPRPTPGGTGLDTAPETSADDVTPAADPDLATTDPVAAPTPAPEKRPDPLRYSRTSAAWAAIVPAVVVLILLVIFIFQNTQGVEVKFLGFKGNPPLAAALLVATAAGMALVALIGTMRIVQLRRRVKREKKALKKAK